MTDELPGGGKPWFIRLKRGMSYQITPCSSEGWMVLGGFVAVNLLNILVLVPEPTPARWVVWSAVTLTAAVLLVVIAYRTSPPEWRDK